MDQEVNPSANNQKLNLDPLGQLKQIKDIIFGPEMDALVGRIESLEEKLVANKKTTREELIQLAHELGKNLDATTTSLEARIEKVVEEFKQKTESINQSQVKRKELGKILVTLGEKFLHE